jgi:hypothetical protein
MPRKTAGAHPEVTRLLNAAQVEAVKDVGNVPATPTNLALLAQAVKENILLQVQAGMWKRLNVTDPAAMKPMVVTARLGNLLTESAIVIEYELLGTPLAMLSISSAKRGVGDSAN